MSDSQINTCVIHGQPGSTDCLRRFVTPLWPNYDEENLCVECLANDLHLMYRVIHRYSPHPTYLAHLARNIASGEDEAMKTFNRLIRKYGPIPSLTAVRKRYPQPPRRRVFPKLRRDRPSNPFPAKNRGYHQSSMRKDPALVSHRYCSGLCCQEGVEAYLAAVRAWRAANHPRPVPRDVTGGDHEEPANESSSETPSLSLPDLRYTHGSAFESLRKWGNEARQRRQKRHTRNVSSNTEISNSESTAGLLPRSLSSVINSKKSKLSLFNCRRSSSDKEKSTIRSKSFSSPRKLWKKLEKEIRSAPPNAQIHVDVDILVDIEVASPGSVTSTITAQHQLIVEDNTNEKRSKWGFR
ncbi:hypothetical protein NPX13_g8428 [Xylaria arbuscula]|uniref:Uncharacterized protein n=1 Tax=Xylaria arbuscula TaxID=114810 RepID=A0A9W8N862_9PEZI|nr:hypothetical protein NPX13_g8428 [Xylaria arbuscula]